MSDSLLDALAADPELRSITDPDAMAPHASDVTGAFAGAPRAVALPATEEQVAFVLRTAQAHAARVVVQGGHSGLAGAATPVDGELVLSTRLLRDPPVTRGGAAVEGPAGVTLADLQRWLGEHRLFGVDMGSRDAATLGGMAATNAGGQWAVRYGTMRDQVLGLRAVLADGTVIDRMAGLPKDTAGYDLARLLVGSEGTLAVITRLVLRVRTPPRASALLLLGVPDVAAAIRALGAVESDVLRSAELFFDDGLRLVCEHAGLRAPFDAHPPVLLLLELVGDGPADALLEDQSGALEAAGVLEHAVTAVDATATERLWALREGHNAAVNAVGRPMKFDVSIPLDATATYVDAVRGELARQAIAPPVMYGHIGDGNLHVSVLGATPAQRAGVADAVLGLAAEHGGTISAEHGIGREKVDKLGLVRTPADIAVMGRVKRAFDPEGTLGRGRVVPG